MLSHIEHVFFAREVILVQQKFNIPIQTFCVVSTIGDFTPVRFRYEESDHSIITVKINEILSHSDTDFAGVHELHFTCSAMVDDEFKIFELKYNVPHHKWSFVQLLN